MSPSWLWYSWQEFMSQSMGVVESGNESPGHQVPWQAGSQAVGAGAGWARAVLQHVAEMVLKWLIHAPISVPGPSTRSAEGLRCRAKAACRPATTCS
jgi:hypothetical protein